MKILKLLIILFAVIFLLATALSIFDPDCFLEIRKGLELRFFPSNIFPRVL